MPKGLFIHICQRPSCMLRYYMVVKGLSQGDVWVTTDLLYVGQEVGIGLTKGVCMYEQQKICTHACYRVYLLITRV